MWHGLFSHSLSQLRALGHYLRVDFKPEWYYEYSLGGAITAWSCKWDGFVFIVTRGCAHSPAGQRRKVPLPAMPLYLVETGVPDTSTGRCVEQVHAQFAQSAIWAQFEKVTEQVTLRLNRQMKYPSGKRLAKSPTAYANWRGAASVSPHLSMKWRRWVVPRKYGGGEDCK